MILSPKSGTAEGGLDRRNLLSSDKHIPSLDGLRAVSILMVLGGHLVQSGTAPALFLPFAPFFSGGLGVRIFFVISGFLISSLLLREQQDSGYVSLRNFYIRRFIRLAPVQVIFVAA